MVQEVTRKFMAQETVFAEILEEVRKKARAQQNFITKTEVEEAFSALSLSAEQMEMEIGRAHV